MQALLDNWPILTTALSGITALLAVIFGPVVQLVIGLRQQRATVVPTNRVRWMDDFRREVAEFIAACHLHEIERYYLAKAKESGDGTAAPLRLSARPSSTRTGAIGHRAGHW